MNIGNVWNIKNEDIVTVAIEGEREIYGVDIDCIDVYETFLRIKLKNNETIQTNKKYTLIVKETENVGEPLQTDKRE